MKDMKPTLIDKLIAVALLLLIPALIIAAAAAKTTGVAVAFFPGICNSGWGRLTAREECKLVALQRLESKTPAGEK